MEIKTLAGLYELSLRFMGYDSSNCDLACNICITESLFKDRVGYSFKSPQVTY